MATYNITIDMDKKCSKCRKPGAMPNGICMSCLSKNMKAGEYDHVIRAAHKKREPIFESIQKISEKK